MMLAASANGAAFGALGAGGLALALTVLLIFGVKGEGKVKLKSNPALICAFIAGTAFSAAGHIWANPEKITRQGLTGLGVGTGTGPLGNVGVGAVALCLLFLMLCWKLTPMRGAFLGLIASTVWAAAGDATVWALPCQLASASLMMIGG